MGELVEMIQRSRSMVPPITNDTIPFEGRLSVFKKPREKLKNNQRDHKIVDNGFQLKMTSHPNHNKRKMRPVVHMTLKEEFAS
ncbi:hypothetical protein AYI70_g2922 [Smittium culicis]|uniref:Uncharacterized protein n=1 Tax=Smittium culicis TaxID=133412 RepID=A0A1R1Y668_9FUNG|nr:hypothetical protein AYI70_g2922 [Smittium culicis]